MVIMLRVDFRNELEIVQLDELMGNTEWLN